VILSRALTRPCVAQAEILRHMQDAREKERDARDAMRRELFTSRVLRNLEQIDREGTEERGVVTRGPQLNDGAASVGDAVSAPRRSNQDQHRRRDRHEKALQSWMEVLPSSAEGRRRGEGSEMAGEVDGGPGGAWGLRAGMLGSTCVLHCAEAWNCRRRCLMESLVGVWCVCAGGE